MYLRCFVVKKYKSKLQNFVKVTHSLNLEILNTEWASPLDWRSFVRGVRTTDSYVSWIIFSDELNIHDNNAEEYLPMLYDGIVTDTEKMYYKNPPHSAGNLSTGLWDDFISLLSLIYSLYLCLSCIFVYLLH